MLKLYNTLSKKIEDFVPQNPKLVTIYCCGPTVYDFAHIGNFRTYTMTDLLVRTLQFLGYTVRYVTNITDVGHLVSDSDTGEDKMEKGARREGKTAWDIAKFYTDAFLSDSRKLNLLDPDVRPKPTEHIPEQISMVETLLHKGFAYEIDDGIYFDTSKFPHYGALTGQNVAELKAGARVEPNVQKRNPTDFALWKFSPKGALRRDMEWESPWGMGFPGWHIECSAMSRKHLGDQIDIHTGGADLIPIHHTNEIAQSEAATGKSPFVRVWMHGQFMTVDGEKMAKSKGNFYRLSDIIDRGYDPKALRYLYLTAHYRSFLNFTWDALTAAQNSLHELRAFVVGDESVNAPGSELLPSAFTDAFTAALVLDMNIPKSLGILWNAIRKTTNPSERKNIILLADRIFGLDLKNWKEEEIPEDILNLAHDRDRLRIEKKFEEADGARERLEQKGYVVEDSATGTKIRKA